MSQLKYELMSFSMNGESEELLNQADLGHLAQLLARCAPHEGAFDLCVPGLRVVKATRTNQTSTHTMSLPGMCIVAQGGKRVSLAHRQFEYDESRMVVYAAEVPVQANIIKASKEEPFLCLVVQIDPQKLADLILKVFPDGMMKTPDTQAIYVGPSNPKIVKSAIRLMELIIQQEDADLLVPLVVEEILIRLLRSQTGPAIAQIGITDSNAQRVARVISWLKDNYARAVKVEEMADIANMSPSSFYSHFKAVTTMSPLQFQKALRLQEARHLMLGKTMSVSNASYQVGYSSVSQFSREYARHFGHSPSKDMLRSPGDALLGA